jgi:hypothetical protein
MNIFNFSDFINETLKTRDIDFTIKHVFNKLSLLRYNFSIEKLSTINTNSVGIISIKLNDVCYINNFKLHLDVLNDILINEFGWFPSEIEILNLHGTIKKDKYNEEYILDKFSYFKDLTIKYEAKYDKESIIPKKLYHLSIQEYENKILKNGLVPKSKSKLTRTLDRIYLSDTQDGCFKLVNQMKFIYFNNPKKDLINTKWIIYEIDTDKTNISLYKDPNYTNGYYTTDNISPNSIKIVSKEN